MVSAPLPEIIKIIQEFSNKNNKYIQNIVIPELQESLDKSTITSLLTMIQYHYAGKIPEMVKSEDLVDKVTNRNTTDDFSQKKTELKNY